MKHFCALLLSILAFASHAELLQVPTGRGDTVPVYWEKVEGATATVFLFNGGNGRFKFNAQGEPRGKNFLIRSYRLFAERKVNVVVVGTREEVPEMSDVYRVNEHPADIRAIAKVVRERSDAPMWLVGTSRGSVSVVATANEDKAKMFSGVVITSSFVEPKAQLSVVRLDVNNIKVPVLVYHHADDGCRAAKPSDAKWAAKRFTASRTVAFVTVEGGEDDNDVCNSGHHSYMGMEKKAVTDIVNWINRPTATGL